MEKFLLSLTSTVGILAAILIGLTFHEVAHGFVALLRGDKTALKAGRLSLNPLVHIDPLGTVILPAILYMSGMPPFGYAKPVPVNPRQLKNPRGDMILVAIAGPAANILLALLAGGLLHSLARLDIQWVVAFLPQFIFFNILLAWFNLLPVPPLDGGQVLMNIAPKSAREVLAPLEKHGMLILVGLFFAGPMLLAALGIHFYPAHFLILKPVMWFYTQLMGFLFGITPGG